LPFQCFKFGATDIAELAQRVLGLAASKLLSLSFPLRFLKLITGENRFIPLQMTAEMGSSGIQGTDKLNTEPK